MRYRKLGRTGVEVSSQCLGAMMFGAMGNTDHAQCEQMIARALDAGVNFVDTADVYSGGESEEIVGRALKGRRDDVVLATKCFNPMGDDPNHRGGSRRWIIRAVEDSLRRLDTDYIDLYQVHRHDPDADLDETLGALTDLVRQGKVRYLGSSSFPAEWIVEAQWVADRRHRERFVCEQPQYSIFARSAERAVLPTCQRHGMGVIPWSPLAGGWLSGAFGEGKSNTSRRSAMLPERYDLSVPANRRKVELVTDLAELADQAGMTLIELALAFVGEHPAVTAPIIGPRTMEHLESQLSAADVTLSTEVLDRIDELVPPGTMVDPINSDFNPPALTDPNLRRRRR